MNETESLIILAEIAHGTPCDLEHHDNESHPAVDCIVIPMGYMEDEFIAVQEHELVIMVCEECANALSPDSEWVLMYCINCNSSQWIYLPLTKKPKACYDKINWLKECPKCYEEKK